MCHSFMHSFMHFVCISVYVFEHSFPVMGEIIRDTDVAGERRQAHVVNFKERSKKLLEESASLAGYRSRCFGGIAKCKSLSAYPLSSGGGKRS